MATQEFDQALNVGVLRGLAGFYQAQLDLVLVSPLIKRLAGELRPLVGADRDRQRSKARSLDSQTFLK